MTPARPEPGWLTDPDDAAGERFWDGVEWTEFRRRYRTAEHAGVAPRPDRSSATDAHDDDEPARVPWVANASADDQRLIEVDELQPTAAPVANPPSDTRPPGWYIEAPGKERWWNGSSFVGPVRLVLPLTRDMADVVRSLDEVRPRNAVAPARKSGGLVGNRLGLAIGLLLTIGAIFVAYTYSRSHTRDAASYTAGQDLSQASQTALYQECQGASSCQRDVEPITPGSQRGTEVITSETVCRASIENLYGPSPKNFVMKDLLAGCVDGFGSR